MKKKVALSATAIAVLASAVPTHVAPVEAEETGDVIYVNSTGAGNTGDGGTGSPTNPYQRISTAVDRAKDGDTIVVVGAGYVNDLWGGEPWVINKAVTIRGEGTEPPTVSVRCPGIVLAKDVKFENIDLELYDSSSAYMYANGHKLELFNTTFSYHNAPIKLYAGAKAGNSNTGSYGTIIVKTDSTFKTKNDWKADIDTIYAGGDPGTQDIPALIQVHQGKTSSISVTNIEGKFKDNSNITSNMDVTLYNISPQVNGGSGKNTLTMGTSDFREVNMSNIHNLIIDQGTIELSNDSIPSIESVNIAGGAILDLRERWDNLTIGTYTGQGGIALPNDSVKVDITQPIYSSESLTVYLHGYSTFNGTNGWHEKDFTYVTTANEDAQVQLYGDNDFDSGYNFIPVSNEGRYEWQVAKPAPPSTEEPEPEEKDPVLTGITSDEPKQSISINSFEEGAIPSAELPFNMVTDKPLEGMTWFNVFEPTIKVGDYTAERRVDKDDYVTYRVQDLGMTIYFELGDGDYNSQKMMVLFEDNQGAPAAPTKSEYQFEIAAKDVSPLTLTLNVEGLGEGDPVPDPLPDEDEPTLPVISEYQHGEGNGTKNLTYDEVVKLDYWVPFEFKALTEGEGQFVDLTNHLEDLNITVNGEPAEYRTTLNDHIVESEKLVVVLRANGSDGNTMYLTGCDEQGNLSSIEPGTYAVTLALGDSNTTATFNLTVAEPQPTLPTIYQVQTGSTTATVKANEAYLAEYKFSVSADEQIDFTKYPLEFTFDGSKAEYREASNVYYVADKGVTIEVKEREAANAFSLFVSGSSTALDAGNHSVVMGFGDTGISRTFTIVVEQPVLPPTIEPEEGEAEPTVTNITFPEGTTKKAKLSDNLMRLELPMNVTFDRIPTDYVDLKALGYQITINGKPAKYNEEVGAYIVEESGLDLRLAPAGDTNYLVQLGQTINGGSGSVQLGAGEYTVVATGPQDFTLTFTVEDDTTTPPSTGGNTGGSSSGGNGGTTTEPTTPPSSGGTSGGSSTGGSTGGGSSSGGTTTEPTTPPSTGGNTGGSSTGGSTGGGSSSGGTTTEPTPPPSTGGSTGGTGTVTPPSTGGTTGGTTTTPPTTEGDIPRPTPVPPKQEVTNQVEGLEDLAKELQQKVDSIMTDISIQENGTIIDLVGDDDDLSNVSALEVTKEGLFINVDGEKVKFNTSLDLSNIDWDNTRVLRVGGGPVPHKQNGEGLTITTSNFNNLLITSKEPEPFTDVNDDDWFKQYVEDAYNYGLVNGTTAETFDPNGAITRAQLAVILARTFELEPTSEDSALSDIGDKWYASEVQALVDAGIIKGFSDGTFGGDKPVTRQQMALMLTRTVQSQGKDVTLPTKAELDKVKLGGLDKTSEEASDAIKYLALMEAVMSGPDIDFRPNSIATRAQATKVLVNTLPRTGLY